MAERVLPKRSLGLVENISKFSLQFLSRFTEREVKHLHKIASGMGDEAVSVLISLNLYPLGLVNWESMEVISSVGPRRPVLLIHGYFHNNSVFYVMRRRLQREGWKHVYRINLKTYAAGVDECAQEIAKKVQAIKEATKSDRVDLIGHSFGGLCSRYYVQALGGDAHVGRLITVGTPHAGTRLSYFGFGPANLDMQPGSEILRELNQELPLPEAVEFTNIWSPFDYMVNPIESAIMEGRVRNVKIDFTGHLGLLFSRHVFNEIFLSLSSDTIHRKIANAKPQPIAVQPQDNVEESSVVFFPKSN